MLKGIRNNLCKFSGEDYAIIQECNKKIQFYFSLIGLFVLTILVCCFLSALNFTEHLFHNLIADIGVGIIWGYVVTNLYLLLLYTITPTILPIKERKKRILKSKAFQLNTSMILRIAIVFLLAIITAQPLNIFILKPDTISFAHDIKILMAQSFWAWLITILVIAIFLLPIYFKYNIRRLGNFYIKKAEIKKQIIEDDYKVFKQKYKEILESRIVNYNKTVWENLMPYLNRLEKIDSNLYQHYLNSIKEELIDEKITKYEYWANPPYRTIHKSQTKKLLSEQNLLKHIYPEIN